MIVLDSGSGPGGQGNYFSAGTYIESVNLADNSLTLSSPAYFPNSGNENGTFRVDLSRVAMDVGYGNH